MTTRQNITTSESKQHLIQLKRSKQNPENIKAELSICGMFEDVENDYET